METKVTALAVGLGESALLFRFPDEILTIDVDGVVDPTEILAEIVSEVTSTVNSLITVTIHFNQISADVDAIVQAVSQTYTVRSLPDPGYDHG